jgi:hypothetical protein
MIFTKQKDDTIITGLEINGNAALVIEPCSKCSHPSRFFFSLSHQKGTHHTLHRKFSLFAVGLLLLLPHLFIISHSLLFFVSFFHSISHEDDDDADTTNSNQFFYDTPLSLSMFSNFFFFK